MTWYYERDAANDRIRLRYEDDSGTIHGPRDVPWPDAPSIRRTSDGWPIAPDCKGAAGRATTDLYADVQPLVGLQALRDLAAGAVEEGTGGN
jgi:hypothetical protein